VEKSKTWRGLGCEQGRIGAGSEVQVSWDRPTPCAPQYHNKNKIKEGEFSLQDDIMPTSLE